MNVPEPTAPPAATVVRSPGLVARWFALRRPISAAVSIVLGGLCLAATLAVWLALTAGPVEERLVGPFTLPSPGETFSQLGDLWRDYQLPRNTLYTLRRVALGFLLAVAVGVPLGVAAGCYPPVNAFLAPVVMFGRNIPLAAVLPLLIFIVPNDEHRKVFFIFVATVAFVLSDAAQAIRDVADRYVDTAYTLGASRWQTIMKVLVPLALPRIFGSCRLMFGIAFGYIMLAESIKSDVGGLGYSIQIFQRRNLIEHIYLILLIIPVIALLIDRLLAWVQGQLFPYQSGSDGTLHYFVRLALNAWDDLKRAVLGSAAPPGQPAAAASPAAAEEAGP